jgi:hypothetical protein
MAACGMRASWQIQTLWILPALTSMCAQCDTLARLSTLSQAHACSHLILPPVAPAAGLSEPCCSSQEDAYHRSLRDDTRGSEAAQHRAVPGWMTSARYLGFARVARQERLRASAEHTYADRLRTQGMTAPALRYLSYSWFALWTNSMYFDIL